MKPSIVARMIVLPLVAAIPLLLLLSRGCGSKLQDVTSDPAFGNFKAVVGAWKTKIPLRLVEIEKKLYLVSGDKSVSGRDLLQLPAGTEIRIEQLVFRSTFETNFLDVMGSLAAGEYSGQIMNIDSSLFARVDL